MTTPMPRKHDRPDCDAPWPRWRVVRNHGVTSNAYNAWAAWGPTQRRLGRHVIVAVFRTHAEAIARADRMARRGL